MQRPMISTAGSAVQTTSKRVFPWIGGPSFCSSPARIRKFHTEYRTTDTTSTKIGTVAISSTSYNVWMCLACVDPLAGNHGTISARGIRIALPITIATTSCSTGRLRNFVYPSKPVHVGDRNFRLGEVDEWRRILTPDQQKRASRLIPDSLYARFGWPES